MDANRIVRREQYDLRAEQAFDVREWRGAAERGEGALLGDLPGGGEEAGERGAREGAADADAAHAERGEFGKAGESGGDDHVDRLGRHRAHDGADVVEIG